MKELFIGSINALKQQKEHDKECNNAFQTILPSDSISGYHNILEGELIYIWEQLLKDKSDWISYYIYELDFGERYEEGMITEDGKNIPLKTVDDLWNILKGE